MNVVIILIISITIITFIISITIAIIIIIITLELIFPSVGPTGVCWAVDKGDAVWRRLGAKVIV